MCNTRISANPPTEGYSVGAPQMLQDAISHTETAGTTASYSWWPPTAGGLLQPLVPAEAAEAQLP